MGVPAVLAKVAGASAGNAESVLDAAPVGLCVLDLDFRYLKVNTRFVQMYGLEKTDFIGHTVEQALPGPSAQIVAHLQEALEAGGVVEREITLRRPAGVSDTSTPAELVYLRTAQPLRDEAGVVVALSVALLDITERKLVEAALHESEENLRYTVELTPHIPWMANKRGDLTYVSPRWNSITGRDTEVRLQEWTSVVHPDDLPPTSALWARSISTGAPYDAEYRIHVADGSWRWVRARAYPRRSDDGHIVQWYGTVEDVHERKMMTVALADANEELARVAQQDYLTRLANRRQFDVVLQKELDRSRRVGSPMALVLLDIDHFKLFNDIGGHLAGDECLRLVAAALEAVIRRPGDLAARYGGEEFALILPETRAEGAAEVAERAAAAVRALHLPHADPRLKGVTISAGVAVCDIRGHHELVSLEQMIAAADHALYMAKQTGRDRVVITAMESSAAREL